MPRLRADCRRWIAENCIAAHLTPLGLIRQLDGLSHHGTSSRFTCPPYHVLHVALASGMVQPLTHPLIGRVHFTIASEGVQQFLGVQYATLKDRFAPAVLKEYSGEDEINATKLG